MTGFRLLEILCIRPPISDRCTRTAGHWDIGKVWRVIFRHPLFLAVETGKGGQALLPVLEYGFKDNSGLFSMLLLFCLFSVGFSFYIQQTDEIIKERGVCQFK